MVGASAGAADVDENQHVPGAPLIMGTGDIGLLSAGFGLAAGVPRFPRRAAVLSGAVALTALGLFRFHHCLGLGMGGMERVAAFPLPLWTFSVGVLGLLRPLGPARPGPAGQWGEQPGQTPR